MNLRKLTIAIAVVAGITLLGSLSNELQARNRVSVSVRGVQVNVGGFGRGTQVSVGRNVYVGPRNVPTYRAPSRVRYSTPHVYRPSAAVRYGRNYNRYYRGW